MESRINASVFPGHQGGPHNHTIAALAVALKQAQTKEYQQYQQQVIKNNAHMAQTLKQLNYTVHTPFSMCCVYVSAGHTHLCCCVVASIAQLVSGGTDNHLILVDVRPQGLDGAKVERICELANIAINKNTVPGDKSALQPGGIRLGMCHLMWCLAVRANVCVDLYLLPFDVSSGSPALTTRGMVEADFAAVAGFIDRAVKIAADAQKQAGTFSLQPHRSIIRPESDLLCGVSIGSTKIKDFRAVVDAPSGPVVDAISKLRADVVAFARQFPVAGFQAENMKYKA